MTELDPYDRPPKPLEDLDMMPTNEDRNLALIAHLSGCLGLVSAGLIGFLGPLLIYLWKRDDSPYVGAQAMEALNFQITVLLIGVACVVVAILSCGILWPMVFIPTLLQVVFGIIAALAVRDGSQYRYPYNFRLLR